MWRKPTLLTYFSTIIGQHGRRAIAPHAASSHEAGSGKSLTLSMLNCADEASPSTVCTSISTTRRR